jgi:hypothetical protein
MPELSMKEALRLIRQARNPDRIAIPPAGAVDVDVVQGSDTPKKRPRYAYDTRGKVKPALDTLLVLKTTPGGLKHQARIEELVNGITALLSQMEEEESGEWTGDDPSPVPPASGPEVAVPAPAAIAPTPVPAPQEQLRVADADLPLLAPRAAEPVPIKAKRGALQALFAKTVEGHLQLEKAIADAGSADAFAATIGVSKQSLSNFRGELRALARRSREDSERWARARAAGAIA